MATIIKTLNASNGDIILPRTRSTAVTMEDGTTSLEDAVANAQSCTFVDPVATSAVPRDSDTLDGHNATYYLTSANAGYDNTTSGLTATKVQSAIDELADEKVSKVVSGDKIQLYGVNAGNIQTMYDGVAGALVGTSDTQTLTNKRITKRVYSESSNATPTPDCGTYDVHIITALAVDAVIAQPTGTPTSEQGLVIKIDDNGTARTLGWNSIYRAAGVALPTTTTLGKTMRIGFLYNSNKTKWDCVALAQEE